ncbi:MAG TPA: hypothetical protein VNX47_01250 [Nevskia sp.]|jgi:hypothetical protein|nr:hypothetical protein [Nevskia sp.]
MLLFLLKGDSPTWRQLLAGNYRKRKVQWRGLTISIENEIGSVRRGYQPDGSYTWQVTMRAPYGYILRTKGSDDEQVDCYLGPDMDTATHVYIIHQRKPPLWINYDECKTMLGWESRAAAIAGYLSHYSDPRFMGEISVLPVDEFVSRVREVSRAPLGQRKITAV